MTQEMTEEMAETEEAAVKLNMACILRFPPRCSRYSGMRLNLATCRGHSQARFG